MDEVIFTEVSDMTIALLSWGELDDEETGKALTLAGRLGASAGMSVTWAVAGADAGRIAAIVPKQRVDVLDAIVDVRLDNPGPDVLVAALAQYCEQTKPSIILFNQSAAVRLIAPRLAGRLGVPVVMNAFGVEPVGGAIEISATAYGGDTHVVYRLEAPASVISLVSTAIAIETVDSVPAPVRRQIRVDLGAVEERLEVISEPHLEGPRLEDARIIVSGGRGLGNAQNYDLIRQLAEVLGGMWGGSRAIVDDGWIDSSHQVGLTGKLTRPALYVAAGISGASQHMAGCAAAKTIVAINSDRDAAIYRFAQYGIVADCLDVLPELIKAARA